MKAINIFFIFKTKYFLWSFAILNLLDVITTKLCVDKYGMMGTFYEANPFVLDTAGNFNMVFLLFKVIVIPILVAILVNHAETKLILRMSLKKETSDVFKKTLKKKQVLDKTLLFLNLFMVFVIAQNLSIYLFELPIFATFKGFIFVNSIIYLTFLVFF